MMILFGAAAAAVKIHDFFEGETLLRDVADEVRLSGQSLAELDRAWASNPRRSDAIISLTSIPSRLPLIVAHSGTFRVLSDWLGLPQQAAPVANSQPLRLQQDAARGGIWFAVPL